MNTPKLEDIEKALNSSQVRLMALGQETRTRATSLVHDLEKNGQKGLNSLIDIGQHAIHTAADMAGRFPALEAHVEKIREEANRLEKVKRSEADLLPIPKYDALAVKDILPLLDGLSLSQLQEIEAYELAHKARKTVLSTVERAIGKQN